MLNKKSLKLGTTMNQHYILNLNPQANHEWDRCVLRNPITGERPDLNIAIAEAVKNQPGSYLIKVSINVEILEQTNKVEGSSALKEQSLFDLNPQNIRKTTDHQQLFVTS